VSIIVGLDSFNFMWLKSRESDIRKMTVYPGEMIMFTNHCLLLECLTAACKALSLANAKVKGTNGSVIRSLDD